MTPLLYCFWISLTSFCASSSSSAFLRRDRHVLDRDRDSGAGGEIEADVLQPVGKDDRRLVAGPAVGQIDQVAELLLLHGLVDFGKRHHRRHDLVEQHAPDRGLDPLVVGRLRRRRHRGPRAAPMLVLFVDRLRRRHPHHRHPHRDPRVQVDFAVVVGDPHFGRTGEALAFAARQRPLARHVVEPQHHVLGGHDDRLAAGRRQDVVGRHHQRARLDLRLDRQRHVHRHLVAVEVRVVGHADQRMELDRLALDQHRLEGLDAEPMERRRAVEQHRMLADHVVEDVPDVLAFLLDHLLGALDGRDVALLLELGVDERLEQLERHLLGQSALMEPEFGTDHDDRAARVVHALAEQVLPKAPGLALEHVAQRFQRPLGRPGDRAAAPAVVEQRVDRLLQHPLLVAHDDVGRVELDEPFEAVVAVDHAPIEIVEVGGRKAAAVQRHQRAQIGRDDRQDGQDHPFGPVARVAKGVDHLQALGDLLAPRLARRGLHLDPQVLGQLLEVEPREQRANRLGAHLGLEAVGVLLARLAILALGQQFLVLERRLARIKHHVALEVQHLLELLERHVDQGADARGQRAQKPDVGDRRGQIDMAHPLAPHLGLDHFDAALLAHHAAMAHALVLAAVALVVLGRTENLGAKEPVALRLEGAVVDGLRLLDLAVRPRPDHLRRRDRNADGIERQRVLGLFKNSEKVFHTRLLLNCRAMGGAAARAVRR